MTATTTTPALIATARLSGLDGLAARLQARLSQDRVEAALDAAAAALAGAAAARLGAPPQVEAAPGRRTVGSADPAAVARETGGLATPADPWLAPALAAVAAVRRGGGA
ncbi:hypothetical protein [Azorhizobium doebereinerae]|uniref:hypothetical protein n=1 Tax=Azorhizobium doebereinerae TaxID=281091 RepID=UPI0003FDAFFD|nr:hypothetical protein [Azorhizobium doebereinerae]